MRRNFDITKHFPNLYRHDRLREAAEQQGLSLLQISGLAGVAYGTTRKVFAGKANNRKVWPVAKVLNVDWAVLHDLKLDEDRIHLAVAKNGRKAAR